MVASRMTRAAVIMVDVHGAKTTGHIVTDVNPINIKSKTDMNKELWNLIKMTGASILSGIISGLLLDGIKERYLKKSERKK